MKRISDGLFKNRARKPRRKDRTPAGDGDDEDVVQGEDYERSIADDDLSSTYSLNSSDGPLGKPKSRKKQLSAGLFKKKRTRKNRRRDETAVDEDFEDPEKIYDEDDVSDSSYASAPMRRPVAKRALNQEMDDSYHADEANTRWSVQADKQITKAYKASGGAGMVGDIDEGDDSDLYTSDEEENDDGGVVPEGSERTTQDETIPIEAPQKKDEILHGSESPTTVPASPAPSIGDGGKPKSKKKKVKGGALDDHLGKTKKKKKSGTSGSVSSKKSTKSTKSIKSPKSKKAKAKDKKTLDTIESQGEFESFAEIDKQSKTKSKKPKSIKKSKSKKKVTISGDDEIPVGESPDKKKPSSSIFIASNLLKEKIRNSLQSLTDNLDGSQRSSDSNHGKPSSSSRLPSFTFSSPNMMRTSRKTPMAPISPSIPENEPSESNHDPEVFSSCRQNPEEIDGKKIKAEAASKIRAFAMVLGKINDQKDFLAAFNGSESDDDKDDKNKPKMSKEEKKQEGKRFSTLLAELHKYETMLEKERNVWSQERYELKMKQESVEQLLNEEAEKNVELQSQLESLQDQLANGGEAAQVEDLKAKNLMLEAENDLLQQKNERNQETIASLVKEAESDLKRQVSVGVLGEGGSMELMEDDASDDWESGNQSGFMSMASLGGKAQGELLQLRSNLSRKDEALEQQAREMAKLEQELETLREKRHVSDLTHYVQNLETEKKFFVSEIEKLKKELASSRQREHQAATNAAAIANKSSPESNAGGWFSFGGGKDEKKDEKSNNIGPLTLSELSPKMAGEKPSRTVSEVLDDDKPRRLSDLLDF
ncbi:unnamed protein product [Cylindrotheca closterium]|uniref:Uncharacterized protein n=1 Tax=Cylindrotheca closterium TaxID=2856 RepID=A0AAD2JK11_9STRA|nr:unnamed protein product [Cylindrotheca closterium]